MACTYWSETLNKSLSTVTIWAMQGPKYTRVEPLILMIQHSRWWSDTYLRPKIWNKNSKQHMFMQQQTGLGVAHSLNIILWYSLYLSAKQPLVVTWSVVTGTRWVPGAAAVAATLTANTALWESWGDWTNIEAHFVAHIGVILIVNLKSRALKIALKPS